MSYVGGCGSELDKHIKLKLLFIGRTIQPIAKYEPRGFKRIKIKYIIRSELGAGNPIVQYNCAVGYSIKRLVVYAVDPMRNVINMLNATLGLMITTQLLNSLMSMLEVSE